MLEQPNFDENDQATVYVNYLTNDQRNNQKHGRLFVFPKTYGFTITKDQYESLHGHNFVILMTSQPEQDEKIVAGYISGYGPTNPNHKPIKHLRHVKMNPIERKVVRRFQRLVENGQIKLNPDFSE